VKIIKVIEDLCHGCGACSVACKFEAITEKAVSLGQVSGYSYNGSASLLEARINIGVMSPVPVIKAAIKKADNQSDIILLDSPPGTSCPFIQTVADTDYVILVTEPTPFGLSDLKQSIETLKKTNKPCGVIINRSGLGNNKVQEYLIQENIPLLLEIPFSKKIAGLYSRGKIVSDSDSDFSKQLLTIAENIILNDNSSNKR
jgi:MinD superfamily P-loop ATPase